MALWFETEFSEFHPLDRSMTATTSPLQHLARSIRQSSLIKFCEHIDQNFEGIHLKELSVESVGPNREMRANGRDLINSPIATLKSGFTDSIRKTMTTSAP